MSRSIILLILSFTFLGAARAQEGHFPVATQNSWSDAYARDRIVRDRLFAEFATVRDLIGIEVIAIGRCSNEASCFFGHAALRFVQRNNDPLNDLVVSYGANVTDPKLDKAKALNGGYRQDLSIARMRDILNHHLILQRRSVSRIILPATPQQLLNLQQILLSDYSNSKGAYTFLWRNCTSLLITALRRAGFPVIRNIPVPSELENVLLLSGLAHYPPIHFRDTKKFATEVLPYLTSDRIGQLRDFSLVHYKLTMLLMNSEMKRQGVTFRAYRSKPPGNLGDVTDEILFGFVPVDPHYYLSEHYLNWSQDRVFVNDKRPFCSRLQKASYEMVWKKEIFETLHSGYKQNCISD